MQACFAPHCLFGPGSSPTLVSAEHGRPTALAVHDGLVCASLNLLLSSTARGWISEDKVVRHYALSGFRGWHMIARSCATLARIIGGPSLQLPDSCPKTGGTSALSNKEPSCLQPPQVQPTNQQ